MIVEKKCINHYFKEQHACKTFSEIYDTRKCKETSRKYEVTSRDNANQITNIGGYNLVRYRVKRDILVLFITMSNYSGVIMNDNRFVNLVMKYLNEIPHIRDIGLFEETKYDKGGKKALT